MTSDVRYDPGAVADLDGASAERARRSMGHLAEGHVPDLGLLGPLAIWIAATGGTGANGDLVPRLLFIPSARTHAGSVEAEVSALATQLGATRQSVSLPAAADVEECWTIGSSAVDIAADEGTTLLLPALVATGPPPAALAAAGLLGHLPPEDVVGVDDTGDDDAWMAECAAVRDAMFAARSALDDPAALLASLGDGPMACLTAILVAAARRGLATLLEGVSGASAALLARRLSPRAAEWWWPASSGGRPAELLAWRELDRQPVLDLGVRTEGGLGSVLALGLVRAAARLQSRSYPEPGTQSRT